MASLAVAYVLWFFFGWLGIHHLYLGRVNQAFVWFATCGGGFGVGWLRDLWRLPDYVRWTNANKDKEYQKEYLTKTHSNCKPGCSYFQLAGMLVMGFYMAFVFSSTIPEFMGLAQSDPYLYMIYRVLFLALIVIGNAVGVYLVINNGDLMSTIYYPLGGAIASIPCLIYTSTNIFITPIIAVGVTWYKGIRWKPIRNLTQNGTPTRRKHCRNASIYLVACIGWLCVFTGGVYYNGNITMEDGEKIPVREAIANFFKSPAWQQTRDSLYQLFQVYRHAGWGRLFDDARKLLDFSGETTAFKVLDLSPETGQEEISKRCRKLKAQYHPDRFKTEQEKEEAQEKFYEIQDACNTLSNVHTRRMKESRA